MLQVVVASITVMAAVETVGTELQGRILSLRLILSLTLGLGMGQDILLPLLLPPWEA